MGDGERNERKREGVMGSHDPGESGDASFEDSEEDEDSGGEAFASPPRKIRRHTAEGEWMQRKGETQGEREREGTREERERRER